jgi:uncharacterized membrane protein
VRRCVISAIVIAAVTILIYPMIICAAILERGYDATGGEEVLFVSGITLSIYTVLSGFHKQHIDKYVINDGGDET